MASEGQAVSGKYWLSSIKKNMAVVAYCDMETGGELGQTSILAIKDLNNVRIQCYRSVKKGISFFNQQNF